MSNYTITTDFGAKDDLLSGNAAKVIKGSEFTTEFTNIKTAVNSKADSVSPTFTGDTALNGTTTFGPDGTSTFNGTVNFTKDVTFDTNTMFVDVSENRVGIGRTSPITELEVLGKITASVNNDGGFGFNRGGSFNQVLTKQTDDIVALVNKNNSPLLFKTNNAEKMRIDSSGNVGISNTTTPQRLTVGEGVATIGLQPDDTNGSYIRVGGTGSATSILRILGHGDTEKARFTASDKLLIGKTEESVINTVGIEAHPAGLLIATRDGNIPLIANRKTDNGAILQLRKDGEPVGSIGTIDDEIYIESGDVGLQFDASGNDIVPYGGGYRDATIDLGSSTNRFKDLYLSGGIEFGGSVNSGGTVSSSNKLDDYEEGSWTISLSDDESTPNVSPTTNTTCRYVKVGDIVTIAGQLVNINKGSLASSAIKITGLPFTIKSGATRPHGSIQVNNFTSGLVDKGIYVQGQSGTNYCTVKANQSGSGAGNLTGNILASDNTSDIFFSLTYIAQ